jgi:hypothetical protein
VRPASSRSLRGPTYVAIIADELAHWRVDEYYENPDAAVLGAARPGLMTTHGPLIMMSSPWARRGMLWDTYNKHFGPKGLPSVLVARGTTRDFNPTISQAEIDRELERDPETNRAEYLAEFRADLEQYVRREAVEACIAYGVYERPPLINESYHAFDDPATGSGEDSWTLAIGHSPHGKPNNVETDLLREWRPPSLSGSGPHKEGAGRSRTPAGIITLRHTAQGTVPGAAASEAVTISVSGKVNVSGRGILDHSRGALEGALRW